MDRCERACKLHEKGCNCCQSVLAAFSDMTGMTERESMRLGAGFGVGAGTGELCGAISGAVMVLGLLANSDNANPGADLNISSRPDPGADNNNLDPVSMKKRTVKLSRELQARFLEKFGALRCQELLPKKFTPDESTPAALRLGIQNHCRIMIVTAVELTENLLLELNINNN